MFGLSEIATKLILYAVGALIVVVLLLGVRQHYVNLGYAKAIAAVKKQDDKAIGAAQKVEQKTKNCNDQNGYWNVLTKACELGDDQ